MAQDSYSFFNLASYDYFRIGRKYKEDPDDFKSRYIGKTVIFYEPLNEKQKKIDLRKIKNNVPYTIRDIQYDKYYITLFLCETNTSKAKTIKMKYGWDYGKTPDYRDIPMYIKEYYDEAVNTFVGISLIYKGEPYKIVDIDWIVAPTLYSEAERHSCFVYENKSTGHRVKQTIENAFSGSYHSTLTKVEKPSDESIRYGESKTIMNDSVTRYSYVDNIIDIVIYGDSKGFYFDLKNVSENSLKIIWNEAVFVGLDGMTSKIMHSGTKYSQKEGDQPASVIIRGAKINDMAIPIGNVSYNKWLNDWTIVSMYPKDKGHDGQVQLMLPIQIKETINEYIFIFDVKYTWKHPELHPED